MALSCTPMEVMMEWPSCSTAIPSASIGPDVIRSGSPSGKRWRHRWLCPSAEAVRYIHDPSGDQPTDVHGPWGPIGLAAKRLSREISRQSAQPPLSSISTTNADLWSGEAAE